MRSIFAFAFAVFALFPIATSAYADGSGPGTVTTPNNALPPAVIAEDIQIRASTKYLEAGDALVSQGRYADAIDQYNQCLAVWSGSREAVYGLARCAEALGDTQDAIQYYRKVIYIIKGDPDESGWVSADGIAENDAVRLVRFGILLCKTQQYQESLTVYKHAIRIYFPPDKVYDPDAVMPATFRPGTWALTPKRLEAMEYVILGEQEENTDSRAEAPDCFKTAIELAPDSAMAHYEMAEWQQFHVGRDAARAEYDIALKCDDGTNAAAIKRRIYLLYEWPKPPSAETAPQAPSAGGSEAGGE